MKAITDDYNMWKRKMVDCLSKYNGDIWAIYSQAEIKQNVRLPLFLELIYPKVSVNENIYHYMERLIKTASDDTILFLKKRVQDMCDLLSIVEGIDLLDSENCIKVYRGIHGSQEVGMCDHTPSRGIKHGFSYTFNPLVAQWFAIRTQSNDCKVVTEKVHIDDVLAIYLDRNESEVIIRPPYCGGKLVDVSVEDIKPSITIMKNFDEEIRGFNPLYPD